MTYSNTIPLPAVAAANGNHDSLYQAWLLLKQARAVPFDARDAHTWRTTSLALIQQATTAVSDHARAAEGPGSPIAWLARRGGVSGGILHMQFCEHESLLEAFTTLERSLSRTAPPSLAMVVDVSERIVEMEIAVARHQNRLSELLARYGMAAVAGAPMVEDGVAAGGS